MLVSQLGVHLLLYAASFFLVWIGSGLVLSSLTYLSNSWRLPRFLTSFFLLGIMTSTPETTIGIIAVLHGDPVIYAGNMLGGTLVMFLGVIPLLGAVGNGVKIPVQFNKAELLITLLVVAAPAFLMADQRLGLWEASFLILMYTLLIAVFAFKSNYWEKIFRVLRRKPRRSSIEFFFKMVGGIVVLVLASNQIVESTLYFAQQLHVSPFFVSLIVIAIGTNIPEISVGIRSMFTKKRDVALANYLGSASANTLLIGMLTLLYGQAVYLPNHFLQRFAFLSVGLILFAVFARTRQTLSRRESLLLLSLYVVFVLFEIWYLAPTS